MNSPHCVRSVLTTSVKILPYRPPARLIRAKYYHVPFIVFHADHGFIFSEMVYEKDITVAESTVSLDILDTATNVSNITFFCVFDNSPAQKFDVKQMLASSNEEGLRHKATAS